MTVTYHMDMIQGTDEWHRARLGILTASAMKNVITPSLKIADNKDTRAHVYEIVSQRACGYLEPEYESFDMQRGRVEEIYAKDLYSKHVAQAKDCGFITNDTWGFTIGYSPDALVGEDGLLEVKSRVNKYQVQTILNGEVPSEHVIQLQTALLVSERQWCDYISYSNGMPMFILRVTPNEEIQEAIIKAASTFEERVRELLEEYRRKSQGLIPTERRDFDTGDDIKPSVPYEEILMAG